MIQNFPNPVQGGQILDIEVCLPIALDKMIETQSLDQGLFPGFFIRSRPIKMGYFYQYTLLIFVYECKNVFLIDFGTLNTKYIFFFSQINTCEI